MYAKLLLIVVLSHPYDVTVIRSTCEPIKVASPIDLTPKVAKKAAHSPVRGLHSHTCPRCGNTWSHGSESFGNAAAHRCAKCGAMAWHVSSVHKAIPVARPKSSCPNGNCPVSGRRGR